MNEYQYAVLARNIASDWLVLKDALSLQEAEELRKLSKEKYDIVRIYKFVDGDI